MSSSEKHPPTATATARTSMDKDTTLTPRFVTAADEYYWRDLTGRKLCELFGDPEHLRPVYNRALIALGQGGVKLRLVRSCVLFAAETERRLDTNELRSLTGIFLTLLKQTPYKKYIFHKKKQKHGLDYWLGMD